MRRRPFILSTLVVLAIALATEIDGALAGGAAPQQATVVVSSAVSGPAWVFEPGVSVRKDGSGSGTVSSVPAGIDCGPKCASAYPWHTSVALTATPALGSVFTGWSEACTGTGTCKVTASARGAAAAWTPVTATFTLISHVPSALYVSITGTGFGTVSSVPAGIDCGATWEGTCSYEYPLGTSVTLTAIPVDGSTFTDWSGACAGAGTCSVAIDAQTGVAVTANFTLIPHCVVPKVKGKTLAAAKHSIESRDCSVGWIRHRASRTVGKGHVLAQKPNPGAQLRQRANVNLIVSKGGR